MGKRTGQPTGRPSKRSDDVVQRIIDGLSAGTPMAVLCRADDMPHPSTFRDWMNADAVLAARIAEARETVWDVIAQDSLDIIDAPPERGPDGKVDRGAVDYNKARADHRLKLLAKWDPKRYGEMIKHAGADGGDLKITVTPEDAAL